MNNKSTIYDRQQYVDFLFDYRYFRPLFTKPRRKGGICTHSATRQQRRCATDLDIHMKFVRNVCTSLGTNKMQAKHFCERRLFSEIWQRCAKLQWARQRGKKCKHMNMRACIYTSCSVSLSLFICVFLSLSSSRLAFVRCYARCTQCLPLNTHTHTLDIYPNKKIERRRMRYEKGSRELKENSKHIHWRFEFARVSMRRSSAASFMKQICLVPMNSIDRAMKNGSVSRSGRGREREREKEWRG